MWGNTEYLLPNLVIFYDDGIKGMYTCCDVSKKLILDFVEEVEYNYGNRPALMRLLRNWLFWFITYRYGYTEDFTL